MATTGREATLSQILTGQRAPSRRAIRTLSVGFRVDPGDFRRSRIVRKAVSEDPGPTAVNRRGDGATPSEFLLGSSRRIGSNGVSAPAPAP